MPTVTLEGTTVHVVAAVLAEYLTQIERTDDGTIDFCDLVACVFENHFADHFLNTPQG